MFDVLLFNICRYVILKSDSSGPNKTVFITLLNCLTEVKCIEVEGLGTL